jgi:HSP20 family protein
MTSRRQKPGGPTGLDAISEISSRLGDLLGAVQSTIEKAGEKAASGESQRDFTIDTEKGPLKATMGWRMKVGGLAGGNASPGAGDAGERAEVKKAAADKPVREPLVDVFVEPDHVLVTAELPGVSAKDVSVHFKDEVLVIETSGANLFRADVTLPQTVDRSASPAKALRNGILELRFKIAS